MDQTALEQSVLSEMTAHGVPELQAVWSHVWGFLRSVLMLGLIEGVHGHAACVANSMPFKVHSCLSRSSKCISTLQARASRLSRVGIEGAFLDAGLVVVPCAFSDFRGSARESSCFGGVNFARQVGVPGALSADILLVHERPVLGTHTYTSRVERFCRAPRHILSGSQREADMTAKSARALARTLFGAWPSRNHMRVVHTKQARHFAAGF